MFAKRALLALATSTLLLASCSSTPEVQLDLSSDPVGAQVYLSRRGERSYRAGFGPVEGDMKSEELNEEFIYLGTSPLEYVSPLEEDESNAKVLGFGGAIVLEYHEGVLRFEKEGFATVERRVRFKNGTIELHVTMESPGQSVVRAESAQP
jgi:hypothetical protein